MCSRVPADSVPVGCGPFVGVTDWQIRAYDLAGPRLLSIKGLVIAPGYPRTQNPTLHWGPAHSRTEARPKTHRQVTPYQWASPHAKRTNERLACHEDGTLHQPTRISRPPREIYTATSSKTRWGCYRNTPYVNAREERAYNQHSPGVCPAQGHARASLCDRSEGELEALFPTGPHFATPSRLLAVEGSCFK